MKLIGLLGGMSWESSAEYYRLINRAVRERLGGQHSARILLHSFDFHEIERLQRPGDWERAAARLVDGARSVERGGAQVLLLCTNTMHRVATEVQDSIGIPLLHIADATAEAVRAAGLSVVGLLGTRFTMEQSFYKDRLGERHGLRVVVPGDDARKAVHDIIYEELCQGQVREPSRHRVLTILGDLHREGAEGVILGCTELPLLVRAGDGPIPVFDTTAIHARCAVDWALQAGGAPRKATGEFR
jgi:aspartate racemase